MAKKLTACVTVNRELLESARLSTCNPVTNEPYTQLAVCQKAGFSGDTQYQRALGNKRNQGVRYETLSLLVQAIQELGGFKPKLNPEDFVTSGGRTRPIKTQMSQSAKAAEVTRELGAAVPIQIDLFLTANFCEGIRLPVFLSLDLVQVTFDDGGIHSLKMSESNQRLAIAVACSFLSSLVNRDSIGHKPYYKRELARLLMDRNTKTNEPLRELFGVSHLMSMESLYSESVASNYFTGSLQKHIIHSIKIVAKLRSDEKSTYTTATIEDIETIVDSFDVATGFLARPAMQLCSANPVAYAYWYAAMALSISSNSHSYEFIYEEIARALNLLSREERESVLRGLMFGEHLTGASQCCRVRVFSPLLMKAFDVHGDLAKDVLLSLSRCEQTKPVVIDEAYTLFTCSGGLSRSIEDDDPYRSFATDLVRSIAETPSWLEVEKLLIDAYLQSSDGGYQIGLLLASVESKYLLSVQLDHKKLFSEFARLPTFEQAKWLFIMLRDFMRNHNENSVANIGYRFELLNGLLAIAESSKRYTSLALWTASWLDNSRLPSYSIGRSPGQFDMERVKQLMLSGATDGDSIGYASLLYSKAHVCSHQAIYRSWIDSIIAVVGGDASHLDLHTQRRCLPVADSEVTEFLLDALAVPKLPINVGWAVVLSLGRMGVFSERCLDVLEFASGYTLSAPDRLELSTHLGILGTRKAKTILLRIASTPGDWVSNIGICGLKLTGDLGCLETQMLKGDDLCTKYALGIASDFDGGRAVAILEKHLRSDNAKIVKACQLGLTALNSANKGDFGTICKTMANQCFRTPQAFVLGNNS